MSDLKAFTVFLAQSIHKTSETVQLTNASLMAMSSRLDRFENSMISVAEKLDARIIEAGVKLSSIGTEVEETKDAVADVKKSLEDTRDDINVRLQAIESGSSEMMSLLRSKVNLRRCLLYIAKFGMNSTLGHMVHFSIFYYVLLTFY